MLLLLVSLIILVWALLPNQRRNVGQFVLPSSMQVPSKEIDGGEAVLQARQVRLEWPASLRIGDHGVITMIFEPVSSEIFVPNPEGQYLNVYSRYNLMAEGRFEAAGVRVDPANPTRESLPPGQTVKFTWEVNPSDAGSYPGKIWLLLRFLPLKGGQASEVPVFVYDMHIQTVSLFGLSGPLARIMAGAGIILGLLFNYDDMIGVVMRWKRKNNTKDTKDTKDFNY